ncbi:calpain-13 [Varanus komodoensis]|uniref:calpain-13 n=1 Tax=Varanus komodoensis TaxID=61221 RepID=UPI001CF78B07|nr:calpain-13 [Varanus komodoensis]
MYQRVQNPRGEGSLASPKKFKNQDFVRLRDHCLNHGLLFEDYTFPADHSSIGPGLLSDAQLLQIQWFRPTDLLNSPHLVVDGMSRFDIVQGDVGDCWVLAALGSLTLQPQFLENVIPKDQGFTQKYAGIFHFQFWYFGDWVDVVIDDRLPFLNGKYLSVHPRSKNEFWPPLLEKAYAKLRGSYRNLHWGYISEALVDFTGGVEESFDLKRPCSFLHEMLKHAAESGCLMGCTTPNARSRNNIELKNGIVLGHVYTIVWATEVPYMEGTEYLIRIWNPWGHGEWNGAWSDGSVEWYQVPEQYRKTLYEDKDDGEFWMSCKDFKDNFTTVHICNKVPTFLDFRDQSSWSMDKTVNKYSGLCCVCLMVETIIFTTGSFSRNPQYSVQVLEPEMKNYNIVVSLSQKPMNNIRGIGFLIDKVGPQGRTRCEKTGLMRMRDVTNYFHLKPGRYIITPIASQEGQEFEFLLRIFLKSPNNLRAEGMAKNMPKWNQGNFYENIFLRYANQSSYLDASQLQRILNEVVLKDLMAGLHSGDGFSFDSSRSLLSLMDSDANGRLTLQDFETLCGKLKKCVSISDKLLQLIAIRYGDTSMRINFPNFACCMIRLETMAKVFHNLSADGKRISFNEDEWMTMIMYC